MKRFSLWNTCLQLVLVSILVSLLPACIIVVEEDDPYDDDYYRRRWQLEIIIYGSITHRPSDLGLYTLSLQENDAFSGRADCTNFEGRYEVGRASTMSVDDVAVEDEDCGASPLTPMYLQGLREARSITGDADELTIRFEGSGNLMRFKAL